MTQNNVIELFAAAAEKTEASTKSKRKTNKGKNPSKDETLLYIISQINLEIAHPVTGLKYKGYLPLCCLVFHPILFLVLKPTQYKVLMYLTFLKWRYPQKSGYVRAALPYLSKGTGVSRASIHRALTNLESYGLLECIEVNHKDGNLYRITDLTLWTSQSGQQSQIETTPVSNLDGSSPNSSPPPSQNKTEDYSSLSPLSLSQHEGFKHRWKSLPKKIAEREQGIIKSILENNPSDLNELYEALVEIEKTGKAYDGQVCRSPIGLIASSWPSIKRIRSARKAEATVTSSNKTPSNSQEKEEILNEVQAYLSALNPSETSELYLVVEMEIRRVRPNIEEIRRESRIFQSFLETTVAARLGRELPETN